MLSPRPENPFCNKALRALPRVLLLLIMVLCFMIIASKHGVEELSFGGCAATDRSAEHPAVLVSYSYFEKDEIQKANLDFFRTVGLGVEKGARPVVNTDFIIVVSGEVCTPCSALYARALNELSVEHSDDLSKAYAGPELTLLFRVENVGMDFGAHNVSIEWAQQQKSYSKYKYFIFLNSSVRGPFFPSYMPIGWQWTQAYTERFRGDVAAVSSSIVCLPQEDSGGYGAHLESWAFAVKREALSLLIEGGVFNVRTCKHCGTDGVVVGGEYGITEVLMKKHGLNVATLMSMYPEDIDWRDPRHYKCNNNVHPSRHGTYDSITMHPFEVVFLKTSWHVGDPFVGRYSEWFTKQAKGEDTSGGSFDQQMYRYAVTPEAQEPKNVDSCYNVLNRPIMKTS